MTTMKQVITVTLAKYLTTSIERRIVTIEETGKLMFSFIMKRDSNLRNLTTHSPDAPKHNQIRKSLSTRLQINLQEPIANLALSITLFAVEYYAITHVYDLFLQIYFHDTNYASVLR